MDRLLQNFRRNITECTIDIDHFTPTTGEIRRSKSRAQSAAAVHVERLSMRHFIEACGEASVGDIFRAFHVTQCKLSCSTDIEDGGIGMSAVGYSKFLRGDQSLLRVMPSIASASPTGSND